MSDPGGRLTLDPGPLIAMVVHADRTVTLTHMRTDYATFSTVLRSAPRFSRFKAWGFAGGFTVVNSSEAWEPNRPGVEFVRRHAVEETAEGSFRNLNGPLIFFGTEPHIDGIRPPEETTDRPGLDDVPRVLVFDYLGTEFDIDPGA